jgi:hypothetical protein
MDIGSVLARAWEIIWKHKILWIFGILAGCTGGGSRTTSSWSTSSNNGNWGYRPLDRFFVDMPSWEVALIVLGLILVILLIIAIAVFLGTIGRVGLIRGTQQAEQGTTALLFGELFSGSMPYFWRVFLLNLVVGLLFGMVIVAAVILVFFGSIATLGFGALCLVPMLCLLIPVAWVVGVLVQQSSIAIVLENLDIMDGLRRGWEIIKLNAGTYILMWLILALGIGLIGGLLIGLPLVFVAAPVIGGLILGTQRTFGSGLIAAGVCLACYLPVAILLNGILTSFTDTAWTLTFMRLSAPKEPAALP